MSTTICSGSLQANGRRITFEGGPALRYTIRLQTTKDGPWRNRWITFKTPVLSLAAALWCEKNIEAKFKYVTVYPEQ